MSEILNTINEVIRIIDEEGAVFRNTKESIGIRIEMNLAGMDLDREEEAIIAYYGDKYEKRFKDEIYHYEQLKFSLFHKLQEIEFFFKEGIENRKTVVLSNDCISMIQYIKRDSYTSLFVHMRSSDVKELLPLDLLYLAKILKATNMVFNKDKVGTEEILVTIGSAHYYTEGGRQ
jgi:thymidylate synthase